MDRFKRQRKAALSLSTHDPTAHLVQLERTQCKVKAPTPSMVIILSQFQVELLLQLRGYRTIYDSALLDQKARLYRQAHQIAIQIFWKSPT